MAVAKPTTPIATIPTRKHTVTSHAFQIAKNNSSAPLQGEVDFNSKLKCCSVNMHSNVSSQCLSSTHFLLDKYNINSTKVSRKNSRRNVRKDLSMETQSMIGNGSANGETILRTVVRLLDRSTKWVLLTAVVSIVVWRHNSPEVLWAVTGCILNEGSSKTLKQIINQPSPASAIGLRKDPGMPSSHAQNLAFVTTYALFIRMGSSIGRISHTFTSYGGCITWFNHSNFMVLDMETYNAKDV
ncbi:lipid phosphate phosphatase epsilon 2, chloroplastic isoform X2 [Cryptomeria japonica]|uniref:lipid phosphate phosphatase epsilon 2, chloroplastic isoform X2 n=1 Tax=Cryptomeria japonica TaxID=3369 RepID=UPI0027DA524B|nr:lipid phosphate phosphatase epsilon 2, chloroplastic isoform X2 [Cryptomeria japonica]